VFADYFTCAVRTGGPGMGGLSLLLVERSVGVETKQMQCMGVWSSGTSYITFDNVKVPVGNLIGAMRPASTPYSDATVANRTVRVWRRKSALERWTTPKLPRRTCSPRKGANVDWAGVAEQVA
jgi:alkylation response protein AidB-like acyl-CoA dehydrogenase